MFLSRACMFFQRIHASMNPLPLLIRAINFQSCTIQITSAYELSGADPITTCESRCAATYSLPLRSYLLPSSHFCSSAPGSPGREADQLSTPEAPKSPQFLKPMPVAPKTSHGSPVRSRLAQTRALSYDVAQASPVSLTNSPRPRKRKCLYRANCRRSRCSSHPGRWLRSGRCGPSSS